MSKLQQLVSCPNDNEFTDKDGTKLKLLGRMYEKARLAGDYDTAIQLETEFGKWVDSPCKLPIHMMVYQGRNQIRKLRGLEEIGFG